MSGECSCVFSQTGALAFVSRSDSAAFAVALRVCVRTTGARVYSSLCEHERRGALLLSSRKFVLERSRLIVLGDGNKLERDS